jgi:protein ImuB
MSKRFVSIWFRHLTTDRIVIRRPELKLVPFVLAAPERGRMVVKAANKLAEENGIGAGMVLADARAVLPELEVIDDKPERAGKLLLALAGWCIRFTPIVAIDPPNGLILDVTGCAHLWGGEEPYLNNIVNKLTAAGYDVSAAMADTPGTAWAVAHYGPGVSFVVKTGCHLETILTFSPAALRLESGVLERMHKLGFYQIRNFISMPRSVLRRRFGQLLLDRMDQVLGFAEEIIDPVKPIEAYAERLPSLEPIVTATGIKIALERLLETLCNRFAKEGKGLRTGIFKGYRVDGEIEQIDIVTTSPSSNARHLFTLFELKISSIEPALGIELFTLEAPVVEAVTRVQESIWDRSGGHDERSIAELLDRLAVRSGMHVIRRFLPDAHHWPERSFKVADSLHEKSMATWRTDLIRPLQLLAKPEPIDVTAPIPDYPPMLFRYKGKLHQIRKADGPERIEREWWLEIGEHRDYYCVEDEIGARYWLFRLGHYDENGASWFIHGFFA